MNQVVQPWDTDRDVLGFILDPTHSYGFSMVQRDRLYSKSDTAQQRAASERFIASGLEPRSTTPDEFRDIIRREIPVWHKVAKQANIKLE